jgi:hypothetical protein
VIEQGTDGIQVAVGVQGAGEVVEAADRFWVRFFAAAPG